MTDSMTQLEYFMVRTEECPACGLQFTEADLNLNNGNCPNCDFGDGREDYYEDYE